MPVKHKHTPQHGQKNTMVLHIIVKDKDTHKMWEQAGHCLCFALPKQGNLCTGKLWLCDALSESQVVMSCSALGSDLQQRNLP